MLKARYTINIGKTKFKTNLTDKFKLANRQDVLSKISLSGKKNLPIHIHNNCRVRIYNKVVLGNEKTKIPAMQLRQADNRKQEKHSMEDLSSVINLFFL